MRGGGNKFGKWLPKVCGNAKHIEPEPNLPDAYKNKGVYQIIIKRRGEFDAVGFKHFCRSVHVFVCARIVLNSLIVYFYENLHEIRGQC